MKPRGILIEADATRDAKMRGFAEEAFGVLNAWVKKNHKRLSEIGLEIEQFDGYQLPWSAIDRDYKDRREDWWLAAGHIKDLFIVFAGPGHTAGMGAGGGKWHMILPVLIRPNDTTYMDTRIYGVRQTFIHEFTHYLDKGADRARFDKSTTSAQRHDTQSAIAYFLHPHEFNAYYQEGASELDNTLELLLRSVTTGIASRNPDHRKSFLNHVRELLPARTQDFVKQHASKSARGNWSENFRLAMHHTKSDGKWLLKFKARLAGLHGHLLRKHARAMGLA